MRMRRTVPAAAASLLAALALAAALAGCGGSSGAAARPAGDTVRSATIPGLGRVLVDGDGYTLYAYMPDRRGPSRCFGMCAHQWPPLVLSPGQRQPRGGPGVDAAKLATVRRPGGSRQVTYDGWPLYTFVNDSAPGQATGQAFDMGAWYTFSVSGSVDYATVRSQG